MALIDYIALDRNQRLFATTDCEMAFIGFQAQTLNQRLDIEDSMPRLTESMSGRPKVGLDLYTLR